MRTYHSSFQLIYNNTEVIEWSGTNAELIGKHDTVGAELEVKYKTDDDKWVFGINHSYSHLLDWEDRIKNTVGSRNQRVSLSDFNYKKRFLELTDTGNSLIYWADNTTKLNARVKLSSNWTLHMDSRIVWEYEYGDDLMEMYRKAFNNVDTSTLSAADLTRYNNNKALLAEYEKELDDKDAFDLNWTFNASLSWDIPNTKKYPATLTLYCQNMFGNNRRYGDFFTNDLPIISWTEELRSFGISFRAEF